MNNVPLPLIICVAIAIGVLIAWVFILKQKIKNMKRYSKAIRLTAEQLSDAWKSVLLNHADYMDALVLDSEDINAMEEQHRVFVVQTNIGQVKIIAKNTCGCEYGDTWRYILQVRTKNPNVQTIGSGTSYAVILDPKEHQFVLNAIKNGQVKELIEEEAVWP